MSGSISTIDGFGPEPDDQLMARRALYTITTAVLTLIIGVAVIDAFGWWNAYGVDSARVSTSGGGYDLEVRYGTVTRPALATPFEITVTSADGFDRPITIAVDRTYLAMWDENGLLPAPSAETTNGGTVEWEFDPPPGTMLAIVYDGRIEPAAQSGRSGTVSLIENGERIARVDFHTRVLP